MSDLSRARHSWTWTLALTAVGTAFVFAGHPATAYLLVTADLLVFGCPGLLRGYRRTDAAEVGPEEAWDNGYTHGLRTARDEVAGYRKPWITLGEERGWDLARTQLTDALDGLLEVDPAPAAAP